MENPVLLKSLFEELRNIVPNGVFEKIDLSKMSRWKIGGTADLIVRPKNSVQVSKLVEYLFKHNVPYVVVGSTTNLLFTDQGLRAVLIQLGSNMSNYSVKGNIVWAETGVWVPGFAKNVAMYGLSGIEHISGIPGTLGGLICMNGGSQRKGIGSQIKSILAVTPTGTFKTFERDLCEFDYRYSCFQNNEHIITEAVMEFSEFNLYREIRNEMLEILKSRREKFPQKFPNCGSTFISHPSLYSEYGPPGKIIEDLGLKGHRIGGAQISPMHANFINNVGNATSEDVLSLIRLIYDRVMAKTGIALTSEVRIVLESGTIKKATDII